MKKNLKHNKIATFEEMYGSGGTVNSSTTQYAVGGSTGGDPHKDLLKRLASQGISVQYGFDGKPQYYKNGKILKGQDHGNAAMLVSKMKQELSRGQVKDSMLDVLNNSVVQVIDPIGVTNYPSAARSLSKLFKPEEYKNLGYQDAVNVAGAIPILGKVKTAGKILSTSRDLAKDILVNPKIKNKLSGVIASGAVGGAGAGVALAPFVDKYQDAKNLFIGEKEKNLNMKKKTPPQYAAGGPVNGFIKDPQTALQENAMLWQRALAEGSMDPLAGAIDMSIPVIQGLATTLQGSEEIFGENKLGKGASAASGMSTTGKRVTVEGGEILENPKGDILKIKGAKHEKGGVTLDLPMNSPEDNYNIYSDRIQGRTGKTLAKEKEDREKKIAKYQKHLQKFPGDVAAKNTLDRLMKSSKLADVNAVNLQQEIRDTAQAGQANINIPEESQETSGPGEDMGMAEQLQAASGVSLGGPPNLGGRGSAYEDEELLEGEELLYSLGLDPYGLNPVSRQGDIEEVIIKPKPKVIDNTPLAVVKGDPVVAPKAPVVNPVLPGSGKSNFTAGDVLGTLGLIQQGIAARKGARANLASLQPETNKYKNYGRGTVEALNSNQSIVDREYQRTLASNELDTFKNASNIDTSSRGIGDKMSNLVALQQIANRSNAAAEDSYADKTVQNNVVMAKTLQDIEDKYLTEETRVQEDNMKNLDAAMEGVTQAGINDGKMLSNIGRIINSRDERDMMRNAINMGNTKFYMDKDGKMQRYPVLPGESEGAPTPTEKKNKDAADASQKGTNPITGNNVDVPVNPTDSTYLTGDKTLDSFNLGAERENLITMLQNPKVNMKIDLGDMESIRELQRLIGNKGGNISGKFGALTYENLKRFIAGESAIQRHTGTGIGVVNTTK